MLGKIIEDNTLFKEPKTASFQWEEETNFDQKTQINENKKKRVTLADGFLLRADSPIIKREIRLSYCCCCFSRKKF